MRVIAGKARHTALTAPPGNSTRPTTDRIKETLFNILHMQLPDCSFLDLFAGSGGIGIEALSRGARQCDFVENSPQASRIIKENLQKTRLTGGRVFTSDVFRFIEGGQKGQVYDIIFMDPPYDRDLEKKALALLSRSPMAGPDTLIIFECSSETDYEGFVKDLGYEIVRVKDYKTNKHVFLKKGSE